ncbi:hypothetical protein AVL48_27315 [Amycolatopsis regifaucium]|uniref:Uncharacterized protein n=1 Tax=Amycolatopsis regifaucium TaxID=546365 RepID=A0A154MNU3_9PSEU|nr:hypothetical protein AVL48_27315 [Amycolatopsis regifaucium]OKA04818.1 hypothetical protein ATP06_0227370 [Amycolatopsis regifaucium]SFH71803.1 hypothetical protein SAMN04489731_10634 [Amycolatopsis regifaucium]
MTPARDEVTERWIAELTALTELYRAAEAAGSGEAVSHEGWHTGARIGTSAANGRLLAYHDSGPEAECVFRAGERTLFNIMSGGYGNDTTERGFAVWSSRPGVLGAVDSGVSRLEVTDADGVVVPAEIVAHTFAVEVDLGPEPRTIDEVFAQWEPPELTVRVYGEGDVLRYEGPLLAPSRS